MVLCLHVTLMHTQQCTHMYAFEHTDIREDVGKRQHRHAFAEEAGRRHFVTRRDVLNLSRKVNHLSKIRHENDAQSVDQMVQELQAEDINPILCYKRQGVIDPAYPTLPAEAFLLAIQTEFQRELFNSFASTIACVDSTHKTNCNSFKLITIIVPDEYEEGKGCTYM